MASIEIFVTWIINTIRTWMSEIEAGDWPTLFATFLAFFAFLATAWTLRRQIEQDRQRDLVHKRLQASQVVVWLSTDELRDPRGRASFGTGAIMRTLNVNNGSGIPVFDVRVFMVSSDGIERPIWERDILPPLDTPETLDVTNFHTEGCIESIRFELTDSNGFQWQRNSVDHLLNEKTPLTSS